MLNAIKNLPWKKIQIDLKGNSKLYKMDAQFTSNKNLNKY